MNNTSKRLAAIASCAAAAISVATVFAVPRLGHSHDHHGHVHVQEAGGKPSPQGAPPRQHLDSNRCPSGSAFSVVNRGTTPIVQIFLRPSATTGGFEEDKLRGRVLQPGQALDLDPGIGRFDVLVLRADGIGATAMRQDPCRISMVALGPDASLAIR